MSNSPIFELRNLRLFQGDNFSLDIPKLDIFSERIYSIIGPSGAGKSTLLRILALLKKPHEGSLKINGQQAAYMGKASIEQRRTIGMVFQQPVLFSGSAYTNVAMGLKLRSFSKNEINRKVTEALQEVGLIERARQEASTLSGGEAQRIALARVLVFEPTVLLLDEPTSGLDPANITAFEETLRKVQQKYKLTIIMITHNLPQAKRLSDFTLFINKGKIVEMSETSAIFKKPTASLTQSFINGEMIY